MARLDGYPRGPHAPSLLQLGCERAQRIRNLYGYDLCDPCVENMHGLFIKAILRETVVHFLRDADAAFSKCGRAA